MPQSFSQGVKVCDSMWDPSETIEMLHFIPVFMAMLLCIKWEFIIAFYRSKTDKICNFQK